MKKNHYFVKIRSGIVLLTFFFAGGLLSACGGERENDAILVTEDNLAAALKAHVDQQLIPAVRLFATQAQQFEERASAFCLGYDRKQLLELQQSWRALSAQWYRTGFYNFGPLNDDIIFPKYTFIDSMRLRGIDYTQSVRAEIVNLLTNTVELNSAYFNTLTFQKVGLLALELLTFETATGEHSNSVELLIVDYQTNPRKCHVLAGMARHLVEQAEYILSEWTVNYQSTGLPFRTLFLSGELEDGAAPISKLLVSIQSHLDYLQKRHVVTMGAQIANYSWQNMRATVDEIALLLRGSRDDGLSFFGLMESAGFKNSVELVEENIALIRQTIQTKDIAAFEINLGRLDGNFKREIPEALAVQLGINFTDGD